MEPSVAGVPTFFGPNYHDFDEAVQILNNESGFVIKKGKDFIDKIDLFLSKEDEITLASNQAYNLIKNNIGSSNKFVKEITS